MMRRVADDARCRERQAMVLRYAGDDVGFHIDRKRAGRAMQLGFLGRIQNDGVHAQQWTPGCLRQSRGEALDPRRIARYRFAIGQYRVGQHPVAPRAIGCEPACDTDADEAARRGRVRFEQALEPLVVAAAYDDLGAGSGDDPPFALQPDDSEDHHMPCAMRRPLVRRRLR